MIFNLKTLARSFAQARSGIAALEFAFIAPVMIILFFGVVEGSNALSISRRVALAANTLADLTSQEAQITAAQAADLFTGVEQIIVIILRSTGPVISTRRSRRSAGSGATFQSADRTRTVSSRKSGRAPLSIRACQRRRRSRSSLRLAANSSTSPARNLQASSVKTRASAGKAPPVNSKPPSVRVMKSPFPK